MLESLVWEFTGLQHTCVPLNGGKSFKKIFFTDELRMTASDFNIKLFDRYSSRVLITGIRTTLLF